MVGNYGVIVGVEGGVAGKTRERPRAGDKTAEERKIVVNPEFGGPPQGREIRKTPAQWADVEAVRVAKCNETQDRRLQAVGGEHRPTARIDGDEGPHNAAQGFEVELMQRQPLAKQAARAEPVA